MITGTLGALRVMWDFLNGVHDTRSSVIETVVDRSPSGHPWLLYAPAGKARQPVVLVHGVTARASQDVNLVHLARCIAAVGHPCVTPPLDRLAEFEHNPADVDAVAQGFCRTRDLFQSPVGVLAFSYGASYALSAASRKECADACRFILGFGAYFRLAAALEHQRQLLIRHADPNFDDADLLYLRYTLLVCQRGDLTLSPEAWSAIDTALADFMLDVPLSRKREPLLRYAARFDYVKLMENYQTRQLSSELSPAGRLREVECPVALLYDPHDRFIPPDHVELIRNELDQRSGVPSTSVLITPMLSHVRVDPMRNLRDAWRLVRLLRPVFC